MVADPSHIVFSPKLKRPAQSWVPQYHSTPNAAFYTRLATYLPKAKHKQGNGMVPNPGRNQGQSKRHGHKRAKHYNSPKPERQSGQIFYIQSWLVPRNGELPPRTPSSLVFPERLNGRRKLETRASLPLYLVPGHSPKDTELWALVTHQQSVLGCPGAAKLKRFFRGGQWPGCTEALGEQTHQAVS